MKNVNKVPKPRSDFKGLIFILNLKNLKIKFLTDSAKDGIKKEKETIK